MITLADVEAAAARIARYVRRTPLVRNATLSRRLGTNVYLKLELFQRTGSFKPRGAFNSLLTLDEDQRSAGVVGFSGGNFAQGLAYAGATLGVDTVILMPETTPAHYLEATRGYGATVDLRPDIAAAMNAADEYVAGGRTMLHPFDRAEMMAGNGSLGLEIADDLPQVTDVMVSVGGGGLITGVATALIGRVPDVRIWPVETEGADCLARSLAEGEQITMVPTSIAKTLGSPYAARAAIDLAGARFEPVTVVPDAAAYAALRFLLERAKVLTEPAASCTLAAAETRAGRWGADDHVVLVLCGGNTSAADLVTWESRFGGSDSDRS